MSDLSGTEEDRILNEWVDDNTLYVSLHSADEGNDPDGTDEVDASDYDREPLNIGDVSITGGGPTTLENDSDITFTESADENWGDVQYGALWDSLSDGNPRSSTVALDNGGTVDEGMEVTIEAGNLTFELD